MIIKEPKGANVGIKGTRDVKGNEGAQSTKQIKRGDGKKILTVM
jgi:hypothetical protein